MEIQISRKVLTFQKPKNTKDIKLFDKDGYEDALKYRDSRLKAQSLLALAEKQEPKTTYDLQDISKANQTDLSGLEFKLKTVKSLTGKLFREGTGKQMRDVLRYTILVDDKDLVSKG